jgi:hypothetical protein
VKSNTYLSGSNNKNNPNNKLWNSPNHNLPKNLNHQKVKPVNRNHHNNHHQNLRKITKAKQQKKNLISIPINGLNLEIIKI